MQIAQVMKTFAVALVLVLAATGLWAGAEAEEGSAADADKRYVTDPVTGKVYTAHEYGGSLTFVKGNDGGWIDAYKENAVSMWSLVYEKLGKLDWALDRDAYPFTGGYMTPLYALRGALAESWEQPDDTTIVINVRQGVHWHDKEPMNGRELTGERRRTLVSALPGPGPGSADKTRHRAEANWCRYRGNRWRRPTPIRSCSSCRSRGCAPST